MKKCNFLVGTSANISGQKAFTNPQMNVSKIFKIMIFLLMEVQFTSDSESTIIEIENEKVNIIRKGSVSKDEILKT